MRTILPRRHRHRPSIVTSASPAITVTRPLPAYPDIGNTPPSQPLPKLDIARLITPKSPSPPSSPAPHSSLTAPSRRVSPLALTSARFHRLPSSHRARLELEAGGLECGGKCDSYRETGTIASSSRLSSPNRAHRLESAAGAVSEKRRRPSLSTAPSDLDPDIRAICNRLGHPVEPAQIQWPPLLSPNTIGKDQLPSRRAESKRCNSKASATAGPERFHGTELKAFHIGPVNSFHRSVQVACDSR